MSVKQTNKRATRMLDGHKNKEAKYCQFHEIFITGCIESYQNDTSSAASDENFFKRHSNAVYDDHGLSELDSNHR